MQCQIWRILPSLGYDLTRTHITLEQYCVKFRIFICHPSPFKVDCLTQLSLAADKRLQSSLLLPLFWAPLCLVRFRRLHFFAPCNHKQNCCVCLIVICSLLANSASPMEPLKICIPNSLYLTENLRISWFWLDFICVGHTAWVPEERGGQSRRSQGPVGPLTFSFV